MKGITPSSSYPLNILYSIKQRVVITPNQWIVFFARSDWLLKVGIVSVIHLPAFCWMLCASVSSFLRKTGLFAAGYRLVCYVRAKTVIHLSVSEEW